MEHGHANSFSNLSRCTLNIVTSQPRSTGQLLGIVCRSLGLRGVSDCNRQHAVYSFDSQFILVTLSMPPAVSTCGCEIRSLPWAFAGVHYSCVHTVSSIGTLQWWYRYSSVSSLIFEAMNSQKKMCELDVSRFNVDTVLFSVSGPSSRPRSLANSRIRARAFYVSFSV